MLQSEILKACIFGKSFNVVLVFRKVCNVDSLFVCYRLTYKVFRNKAYPQTLARLD